MNTLREAAQAALEAFDHCYGGISWGVTDPDVMTEALQTLRAALAQPERKPLTIQQISELWGMCNHPENIESFVRAIERFHGIGGEE